MFNCFFGIFLEYSIFHRFQYFPCYPFFWNIPYSKIFKKLVVEENFRNIPYSVNCKKNLVERKKWNILVKGKKNRFTKNIKYVIHHLQEINIVYLVYGAYYCGCNLYAEEMYLIETQVLYQSSVLCYWLFLPLPL